MKLSTAAKNALRDAGITQAEWARAQGFPDGRWHGDACGCPDDRCTGFHHFENQGCGCLAVLLAELVAARDTTPQPDSTGACPDFGDWFLDTPEPETEPCTVTGDDDACDIAYRIRFRHARHGWPYPVISITAYAAVLSDGDQWDSGYVVRIQTEWLVCDDPSRPEATARFSTGTRADDPEELYDDRAGADETARELAAGLAAGTAEWVLGSALQWSGRDGLP